MEPLAFEIEAQSGRPGGGYDKGDKNAYLILSLEIENGIGRYKQRLSNTLGTVTLGGNAVTAAIAKHFYLLVRGGGENKKDVFVRDKRDTKLFFSYLMDWIQPRSKTKFRKF